MNRKKRGDSLSDSDESVESAEGVDSDSDSKEITSAPETGNRKKRSDSLSSSEESSESVEEVTFKSIFSGEEITISP